MISSLDDYEKLKLCRPILGPVSQDQYKMPVIAKTEINAIDWNKVHITGQQNMSTKKVNKDLLLLTYNYDKKLNRLWNDPAKYVPLIQASAAIVSPDFSVSPSMNDHEFSNNIYKSRWLGNYWQSCGCTVIPSIPWVYSDTYDLCFSGIECDSVVSVSTIGADKDVFLEGFYAMMEKIKPSLVVVYGDMIKGMYGRFVQFAYEDAYNSISQQILLPGVNKIFEIKKEEQHFGQ